MDVQKFGAFIQNCRKDLGMTQGELGAKLNVTDKAISRWERGVGFPDIKLLEPLAGALQISIQELIRCQRMESEQIAVEKVDTPRESAQNAGKALWLDKFRRVLAVLCFLVYALFYALSRNAQFAAQLVWMSPLNRVLFLATVVAFLYASYREVGHGRN